MVKWESGRRIIFVRISNSFSFNFESRIHPSSLLKQIKVRALINGNSENNSFTRRWKVLNLFLDHLKRGSSWNCALALELKKWIWIKFCLSKRFINVVVRVDFLCFEDVGAFKERTFTLFIVERKSGSCDASPLLILKMG